MLTRRRRGSRGRGGFTMIELVVTLAILAALAAVLAPQVMSRLNTAQSASLMSALNGLRDASTAHRGDTGRYPQTLRQLVVAPVTGDKDSCGRVIPGWVFGMWVGPYMDRDIATTGIPVGTSTILNTVRRVPATLSATGTIYIDVLNVDQAVATEMERALDGNNDLATGVITWNTTGTTGLDTLNFAFPVDGC